MKDVIISGDVVQKMVETNLPKMLEDALVDKYDSPLKKAVEDSVKEHSGAIKQFVNEIISTAMSDVEFKKRVGDAVIAKVITSGLSR